jgi:hypothetical protein
MKETPMQIVDDVLVCVQREWNGWQTAEVRLSDLHDIHWFQPDHAPKPLVHGYVSCASLGADALPHNCERTAGPHTLLVCVIKRHMTPSIYQEVAKRAGQCRIGSA